MSLVDRRQSHPHAPPNKLSIQTREKILEIANSPEFCDMPPCQIVPRLADQGRYIASESTFYRILGEEEQLKHRQRSKPRTHHKPKELVASGRNQVWSWDISYLPSFVCGLFFYLYFIVDIYSRKIVGFSVDSSESSEHASALVRKSCHEEGILPEQLSLHSDNGAPMKRAMWFLW